jgi:putative ABC transport system permease protein
LPRLPDRFCRIEGWRVRSRENAAPGVRRFIDRLTFFLSLVG